MPERVQYSTGAYILGLYSKKHTSSDTKNRIMISEIKNIPLADFLSSLGHEPAARKGNRLWYRSPLRQETTPSFKVETTLNCWYDFGIGKGGDIIDLARLVFRSDNIRYISDIILRGCAAPSARTVALSFPQRLSATKMEDMKIVPLGHPALLAYLKERGIPAHIAVAVCREAHYSVNGKSYFAVAFGNVNGGWELRNRYFKGCAGHKDISCVPWSRDGPSSECAVFEGFIDYLSALTLGLIPGCDAIVLNSVANVNKAITILRGYSGIRCFLDNDDAGKTALQRLTAVPVKHITDCSHRYNGYNDLNDYLVSTIAADGR